MSIPDYQLHFEAFPLKYNSIVTGDPLNFPVFWAVRNLIVNYIDQRNYPKDITQPTAVMVKCGQFFNETAIMAIVDDYALESRDPYINPSTIAHVRVFETGRKFVKALPMEYVFALESDTLQQLEEMFRENGFCQIVVDNVNAHASTCMRIGYGIAQIGNKTVLTKML